MESNTQRTQKNRRIEREELIQFTQGCLRARTIDDLVRELTVTIAPACRMEITSLVIPRIDGQVQSYLGQIGSLAPAAEQTIRHHLAELIEEVIDVESNPAELDIVRVDCPRDEDTGHRIEETHIMWTVDLGPSDSPVGLLCLFGPDAKNLNEKALTDLRVVGTLLADAIERIERESDQVFETDIVDESEVIMFEIGHYEAIREVFGRQQAESLSNDIIGRISSCLPPGSSIARVDAARIVTIVRDTTVPAGFLVEKCLDACRHIEISEKILVSIRSAIAPAITISDALPHPLVPTEPSPTGLWQTLNPTGKATG